MKGTATFFLYQEGGPLPSFEGYYFFIRNLTSEVTHKIIFNLYFLVEHLILEHTQKKNEM